MSDGTFNIGIFGDAGTGKTEYIRSFSPYRTEEIIDNGVRAEVQRALVFTDPNHYKEVAFLKDPTVFGWTNINMYQSTNDMPPCIKFSHGAILFFSWADRDSRSLLPMWVKLIADVMGAEFPLAIVGTEYDPERHQELMVTYATHIPRFNLGLNHSSPIDNDGPFVNIARRVPGSTFHSFCEPSPTLGALILRPANPNACILKTLVLPKGGVVTIGRKDLHNGIMPTKEQGEHLKKISREHVRLEYDGCGLVVVQLSDVTNIAVEEKTEDGARKKKKKITLLAEGKGTTLTGPGTIHLNSCSDTTSYVVKTLEQIEMNQESPTSEMHLLLAEKHYRDRREERLQKESADALKARQELEAEVHKLRKELERARKEAEEAQKEFFKRAGSLDKIDEDEGYYDNSDLYTAGTQDPLQGF